MMQEEFFSSPDVATINSRGRGNPDYRGYLAAPNGAIYSMAPGADRQTELQKPNLISVGRRRPAAFARRTGTTAFFP